MDRFPQSIQLAASGYRKQRKVPLAMTKQLALFGLAASALGMIACGGGANYFVTVTNQRNVPVVVRAGTTETLHQEQVAPGHSIKFDLADLDSSIRASYFVSVEPEAGPDKGSLTLSFSRAEVNGNVETSPIKVVVGSERVELSGLELSMKIDGVVIANDTADQLKVGGSVELDVKSGERIGEMLNRNSKAIGFIVGRNVEVQMHENKEDMSFGAPIGVRQGPEGTSVVAGYYFEEEWFRPDLIPAGVGNPQSPTNRNARTREVADILEKYFREHRRLPEAGTITLPDFAIEGEHYTWIKGCFLETRVQESGDRFHFRVYQKDSKGITYWLCKAVSLKDPVEAMEPSR